MIAATWVISKSISFAKNKNADTGETDYTFFFINNQKFKQSPRKSLIC